MNSEGIKAKVISMDEGGVYNTGLLKQGHQTAIVKILQGSHKGEQLWIYLFI